jgi:hypothetical protein
MLEVTVMPDGVFESKTLNVTTYKNVLLQYDALRRGNVNVKLYNVSSEGSTLFDEVNITIPEELRGDVIDKVLFNDDMIVMQFETYNVRSENKKLLIVDRSSYESKIITAPNFFLRIFERTVYYVLRNNETQHFEIWSFNIDKVIGEKLADVSFLNTDAIAITYDITYGLLYIRDIIHDRETGEYARAVYNIQGNKLLQVDFPNENHYDDPYIYRNTTGQLFPSDDAIINDNNLTVTNGHLIFERMMPSNSFYGVPIGNDTRIDKFTLPLKLDEYQQLTVESFYSNNFGTYFWVSLAGKDYGERTLYKYKIQGRSTRAKSARN